MASILYPGGLTGASIAEKVGCGTITFDSPNNAITWVCKAFSVSDPENVTRETDSNGEPLAVISRGGFISGSMTLVWPLASEACPAKGWTFTRNRRIGTSATSEQYFITSVSQPRSAEGGLRTIDLTFEKTTV